MIKSDAYYFDSKDNMVLLNDHYLDFYQQPDRVQIVVKKLFTYDESSEAMRRIDGQVFTSVSGLYIYEGRDLLIDSSYVIKEGNHVVIDKSFFKDYPSFFLQGEDGTLLVDERNYVINTRGEIQPQSAFVIMDHTSGEIKAIMGGRKSFGQKIYNRALVPHQPGSAIKPIGTYSVAIESKKWTAASVIDDVPAYLNHDAPTERWPVNWYEDSAFKYRGRKNLRQGVEDSLNVVTAKLASAVGVPAIVAHLKAIGITTIEEANGSDMNISAVALGGMTYGISPLELTGAYASYANQGVYQKPISFTKITDISGHVIIDNTHMPVQVIDKQVAFIIQDMMRTAVTRGYAQKAQIRPDNKGIPIAGKTGTTSDMRDALFVGYSPYYTAAVWFGNDTRLKMDQGSGAAAEFWQLVMSELHKDLPDKDFEEPEGLIRASVDRISGKRPSQLSSKDPAGSQIYTEIFLPGTIPTSLDDAHVEVEICVDSGQLATPFCQHTKIEVRRVRLEPYEYELPVADQGYMVPKVCEMPEHQSEIIEPPKKVIQTFAGGEVKFIENYTLLLKDGNFVMIPKGASVSTSTFDITFPGGYVVKGESYTLQYITQPETQDKALSEQSTDE